MMTEQYLKECRDDFEKALKLTKLSDGKLSFTKTFTCESQKDNRLLHTGGLGKNGHARQGV